jgi:hypothetical protein
LPGNAGNTVHRPEVGRCFRQKQGNNDKGQNHQKNFYSDLHYRESLVKETLLRKSRKRKDSGYGSLLLHLEDIPGFITDVEKMTGHKFFNDLFGPVGNPGEPYLVTIVVFRDDIKILNASGPAFYAVSFHYVPPSLLVSEFERGTLGLSFFGLLQPG